MDLMRRLPNKFMTTVRLHLQIKRVEAILLHLMKTLTAGDKTDDNRVARQRRTSILAPIGGADTIPVDTPLNYLAVEAVPSLPMFALFDVDKSLIQSNSTRLSATDYDSLFQSKSVSAPDNCSISSDDSNVVHSNRLGSREANLLVQCLVYMQLPGLTRLEQMYLMAITDSLANVAVDRDSTGEYHCFSWVKTR